MDNGDIAKKMLEFIEKKDIKIKKNLGQYKTLKLAIELQELSNIGDIGQWQIFIEKYNPIPRQKILKMIEEVEKQLFERSKYRGPCAGAMNRDMEKYYVRLKNLKDLL